MKKIVTFAWIYGIYTLFTCDKKSLSKVAELWKILHNLHAKWKTSQKGHRRGKSFNTYMRQEKWCTSTEHGKSYTNHMRAEKSYTRCMQHGKSHKIYRRHEQSFNVFIQHGILYTIYMRHTISQKICIEQGN